MWVGSINQYSNKKKILKKKTSPAAKKSIGNLAILSNQSCRIGAVGLSDTKGDVQEGHNNRRVQLFWPDPTSKLKPDWIGGFPC